MKTRYPAFRLAPGVMALFLLSGMFLASCGTTMKFSVSSVVPAAEGKVVVKTDRNNNHTVAVKVGRLAVPGRLTPPYEEYVVWMETREHAIRNIGRLKSKSGTFTNSLNASLKTVTSFEPRSFFITAEHDGNTQVPGPLVVLRTQ